MNAARLARAISVCPRYVRNIVKGRRKINGETAILFGYVFMMSPEFWMNLQAGYDLQVARAATSPDSFRAAHALSEKLQAVSHS